MRAARSCLIALFAALLSRPLCAQPASEPASPPASGPSLEEEARLLFEAAEAYYKAEHYAEAREAYAKTYALVSSPGLLFNMAQCERLLGQKEQAVTHYRAFLEAEPKSPYRQEIE